MRCVVNTAGEEHLDPVKLRGVWLEWLYIDMLTAWSAAPVLLRVDFRRGEPGKRQQQSGGRGIGL